MEISKLLTEKEILAELGERLKAHRINNRLTQTELSERAEVTRITVHNVESGKPIQTNTLVRLMRALGLIENLEQFIPKPSLSIAQMLELEKKQRPKSRVRKPKAKVAR